MKTIVITGASSFIAISLIKMLKEEYNIIAVIRKGRKGIEFNQKNTIVIEENMDNYKFLDKKIKKCDILMNFAWQNTKGKLNEDEEIQRISYKNTLELCNSLIKIGCKKIIQIGSIAEYGLIENKITENTLCNPINKYGKYKYKAYLEIKKICQKENINFIEARLGSVYSTDMLCKSLITQIIKNIIENKKMKMTYCTQLWEFIHIDDVNFILKYMIENEMKYSEYNLSTGKTKALKSFVEVIIKNLEYKDNIIFGKISQNNFGCFNICCDIERLKTEMNFKPKKTFEENVKEMIKYYKNKVGI